MSRQYYTPRYGYIEEPMACVKCGANSLWRYYDPYDKDGFECIYCRLPYYLSPPMPYIEEPMPFIERIRLARDAGEKPKRRKR